MKKYLVVAALLVSMVSVARAGSLVEILDGPSGYVSDGDNILWGTAIAPMPRT